MPWNYIKYTFIVLSENLEEEEEEEGEEEEEEEWNVLTEKNVTSCIFLLFFCKELFAKLNDLFYLILIYKNPFLADTKIHGVMKYLL